MARGLIHPDEYYTPSALLNTIREGNEQEVRSEYSKLRAIAMKRLSRLEAAGMDDTQSYLRNINHYPKLKDIKTKQELAGRLSDLSRFIKAKQSTVSGQKEIRKKTVETLNSHGYDFVNMDNVADFGLFMEEYRKQKLEDQGYDSGDAADTYSVVVKHKIDPKELEQDFEFWLEHVEEAKALRRSKASEGDYDKLKKRLEKKVKKPKARRARYSGALKSMKSSKSRKSSKRR